MDLRRSDPQRWAKEAEFMASHTRAQLVDDGSAETPFWVEDLTSNLHARYRLLVFYPDGFPHVAPRARVLLPDVGGAPHLLADGTLCLFPDPLHGAGAKTTALMVRNRAVVWFLAYELWKATGEWIGPAH